ncbi:unnamed protein product [Linum tenue]|uniref:Thioredoxin domain-containing protein n=1 Tax=Linum tenue TaxID=586396 RepID=A0AAV0PKF2_9ROSI|nr:unnamed protein product [Linum tenue]
MVPFVVFFLFICIPFLGSQFSCISFACCNRAHARCSMCSSCSQILPAFLRLSDHFPKLSFVYADIDECPETTNNIRFAPSFHFYRDGEKVDEIIGAGEERLHDRLWLHS